MSDSDSTTKKLTMAGDVRLSDVILLNASSGVMYNITPQVTEINIYESINNIFVQGDITLLDTQNLTNLFPLTGNEVVYINFDTEGCDSYKKAFVVVNISEKIKHNRQSLYRLSLISAEAVVDRNTRISRKFTGDSTQVIRELLNYYRVDLKEYDQPIDNASIEPSSNSVTFISNMWSPSKCINFTLSRYLDIHNKPSFLFFENKYGFQFLSLQSIIIAANQTGPVAAFRQYDNHNTTNDTPNSTSHPSLMSDYSRILGNVRYLSGYDYFKRLKEGFYGSEVIGLDLATAQYTHNRYDIVENSILKRHATLNDFLPTTYFNFGSSSGHVKVINRHAYTHDNVEDPSLMKHTMTRDALMSAMNNGGKLVIDVYGRTCYGVGQVVHVLIPKDQQITKQDSPWDKLISGNYMIYELKHSISVGAKCSYVCTMNLCKDSYITDVNSSSLTPQHHESSI